MEFAGSPFLLWQTSGTSLGPGSLICPTVCERSYFQEIPAWLSDSSCGSGMGSS
jgi:hypothetical protein